MLESATGCLVLVARGFLGLSFLVFVSLYCCFYRPMAKLFWWQGSFTQSRLKHHFNRRNWVR
jgi:hypothetical protein